MKETSGAPRFSIASLLVEAAQGRCPQCGAPALFASVVRFAARCRQCELDYDQFNVGDGPAAFLTMIIGGLMLGIALVVEFAVHPPVWLHVLLWAPLTVAAVVGALRVAKAALLTLEYRNQAREGALAPTAPPAEGEAE